MVWNFRNLKVWKVYDLTGRFPDGEKYALTSQLRRAVISISSNIAEGCGRRIGKDFVGFLYNALGSAKEVESQLLVGGELEYLSDDEVDGLVDELGRVGMMLFGLIGHVSEKGIR